MADSISPEQIRSRVFRTTFRGFDQLEVGEFLDRVARILEELEADRVRLAGRLEEFGDRDLSDEFRRVGEEVGQVLVAARAAADGMRERAAAEVAAWRADAEAEAAEVRRAANADAEALRGDAWTTAEDLLAQAQEAAKSVTAETERRSLATVGEAEREAHRRQTAARREAEEVLRTAKMEAERLLVDARSRSDEIIENARKAAEAAQERARALEVRREELLGELETVRSKIHAMEADIEERSKEAPPEEVEQATVRVVQSEPRPETPWQPEETVRIIPASKTPAADDEPVDAAEFAAEVRRLRDVAELEALAKQRNSGEEQPPPEAEADVAEEEPAPPVEEVADAAEEPAAAEAAPDAPKPTEPEAEIATLFDALRTTDEMEAIAQPEAANAEAPPEPEVEPEAEEEAPPPQPETPPPATMRFEGDPFVVRDQLLLPITNRALRSVKRQLTEAQNITLEQVRVDGAWSADVSELAERVRPDLTVIVQESYAAGLAAVGSMVGSEPGRPRPAAADVPDHSQEFAGDLMAALSHAADAAGDSPQGPLGLSAVLSRVFRAWRTDEAERRLRAYAFRAYHRGVLAGCAELGEDRKAWIVSGRGCATCREAGAAGGLELDTPYPGGHDVPPAHDGCACTIVPA